MCMSTVHLLLRDVVLLRLLMLSVHSDAEEKYNTQAKACGDECMHKEQSAAPGKWQVAAAAVIRPSMLRRDKSHPAAHLERAIYASQQCPMLTPIVTTASRAHGRRAGSQSHRAATRPPGKRPCVAERCDLRSSRLGIACMFCVCRACSWRELLLHVVAATYVRLVSMSRRSAMNSCSVFVAISSAFSRASYTQGNTGRRADSKQHQCMSCSVCPLCHVSLLSACWTAAFATL